MSTYNVNLHEAIYSLSDALDLVGVTHIHHGKRVAYMAAECGKHLGWSGPRLDDLFQAAILHDSGVSRTMVHAHLAQMAWENEAEHCRLGADLLATSPLLKHLSDTVLHHHTHWSVLKNLDLPPEVKLRANCIYMVDRVDVLALGYQLAGKDILLGKDEIRHKIFRSPRRLVLSGTGRCIHGYLNLGSVLVHVGERPCQQLPGNLAVAFSGTDHGVRRTAQPGACFLQHRRCQESFHQAAFRWRRQSGALSRQPVPDCREETCEMLELVGLLHDIGKLRVPDKLLDKPGMLNEEEIIIMRRHSFDTYSILKNIRGLERVSLWALQHHERMDGSGYPYQMKGADLSFEARIVAVADVFQALAQERPYRGPLEQQVIMALLKPEAAAGKLDMEVVAAVEANLAACWRVAVAPGYSPDCCLPARIGLRRELRQIDQRRRLPARLAVFGHDVGEDAAAHVELGGEAHETGLGGGNQVVQHAVGHILMEMPFVAESPDVQLQALQLHAFFVGDVIQDQGGEIRLAGLGAQAGEFRDFHVDVVVAPGLRVGESFQCLVGCVVIW